MTGGTRGHVTDRDERVLKQTRVLGAFIVPFLLVAFALLYLFADDTKHWFAWEIHPDMTPLLMGAIMMGLDGRPSAIHITLQGQAIGSR